MEKSKVYLKGHLCSHSELLCEKILLNFQVGLKITIGKVVFLQHFFFKNDHLQKLSKREFRRCQCLDRFVHGEKEISH